MKGFFITVCFSLLFFCSAFAQDTLQWSRPYLKSEVGYFYHNLDNFNAQLRNSNFQPLYNFTSEFNLGLMTVSPNKHWRLENTLEFALPVYSNNYSYPNKVKMYSWGGYGGVQYDFFPKKDGFHLFPLINIGLRSRTLDFIRTTGTPNTIATVLAGNVQQTSFNYLNAIFDFGLGFETNWGRKNYNGYFGTRIGYRIEAGETTDSNSGNFVIPNTNFGGWFLTITSRYGRGKRS